MSQQDPANPPATPPAEPPQPTAAQAQQIATAGAQRAGEALQQGANADEIRAIVREEMAAAATRMQVQLQPTDLQQIADATITQLESLGAFERGDQHQQHTPPPGGDAAAHAAAGAIMSGHQPPAPANETQPRRDSFADRFLGRKQR